MYQVLARKYRPQRFDEVVGQEHITTTLKNALASQRIHHAYLFTGVRGVGKTTVARILAKALNCAHPNEFEPCGTCAPCQEITEGRSLDVQEIDGASNTGVDDVREIREHVKYLPSTGHYKIYIIDEVHMLSTAAFNALLKTLEEPPKHVIFMFATTESHKIPATILSRCQRYDFRRIPVELIARNLSRIAKEEAIAIDEDALKMISREATGSLRDAQSLFDQSIAFAGTEIHAASIKSMLGSLDRSQLFDTLTALLDHDAERALTILDELYRTGTDLTRFSCDLLELVRHLLVLSECGQERAAIDLPTDEISRLGTLGTKAAGPEFHQLFSLLYGIAEAISRSPFPKMLLEVGLIRACRIAPMKPIGEIVAKLDALLEGASLPQKQKAPSPEIKPPPKPAPAPKAPKRVEEAKPREQQADTTTSKPTFEPAQMPVDTKTEERWQSFLRWLVVERPQAAAILQQGTLESLEGNAVRIRFANAHYADMQLEEDRRQKTEELITSFFQRPMTLDVLSEGEVTTKTPAARAKQQKEVVREALNDEIVRQAADIFGAKLHDVKVEKS